MRGLYFCARCGCYAAVRGRDLLKQCVGQPSAEGRVALRNLLALRLPRNCPAWPSDILQSGKLETGDPCSVQTPQAATGQTDSPLPLVCYDGTMERCGSAKSFLPAVLWLLVCAVLQPDPLSQGRSFSRLAMPERLKLLSLDASCCAFGVRSVCWTSLGWRVLMEIRGDGSAGPGQDMLVVALRRFCAVPRCCLWKAFW